MPIAAVEREIALSQCYQEQERRSVSAAGPTDNLVQTPWRNKGGVYGRQERVAAKGVTKTSKRHLGPHQLMAKQRKAWTFDIFNAQFMALIPQDSVVALDIGHHWTIFTVSTP